MATVAVTGHRPHKLGFGSFSGYVDNPLLAWIRGELRRVLHELKPLYGISGMAIGIDQLFAEACIELKIPFIAAVPFRGQESVWPIESRVKYYELLGKARETVVVSEGTYEKWKLIARNHFMVDHCNTLIACWDGSAGGTGSTVQYALSVHRDIVRINPSEFRSKVSS